MSVNMTSIARFSSGCCCLTQNDLPVYKPQLRVLNVLMLAFVPRDAVGGCFSAGSPAALTRLCRFVASTGI